MYKDKKCANPCPETCPAQKCEEFDGNGDGDIIDETYYRCVLATAAAPTAAAPIAYGSQTAAAAGGVILGTTLSPVAECCEKVNDGTFSYCPADKKEGYCPKNTKCVNNKKEDPAKETDPDVSICCPLNSGVGGILGGLFCKPTQCDSPDEEFCPASMKTSCCKKLADGTSPCGQYSVGLASTWAYCKNDSKCDKGAPGYCAKELCCDQTPGQKETCESSHGVSWCQPETENDCDESANETYCPGSKQFSNSSKCCLAGETCYNWPSGVPDCAK